MMMVDYSDHSSARSRPTFAISPGPLRSSGGVHPMSYSLAGGLVDTFSPASPSYCPSSGLAGWTGVVPSGGNGGVGHSDIDMFVASQAPPFSSQTAGAILPTASYAALPCSMATPCPRADPMLPSHRDLGVFGAEVAMSRPFASREEEREAWFPQHHSSERSHSSMGFFPVPNIKGSSLSTPDLATGTVMSSPAFSFVSLSTGVGGKYGSIETASASPSESTGSQAKSPSMVRGRSRLRRNSTHREQRYQCPVCHRPFDKKYNLREHEKRHDPNRVSRFPCPEPNCSQRLGRKTDVNRHISSVHEKAKKYACPRCSKRFDRKDTLSRHCDRDGACPYSNRLGEAILDGSPGMSSAEGPSPSAYSDHASQASTYSYHAHRPTRESFN